MKGMPVCVVYIYDWGSNACCTVTDWSLSSNVWAMAPQEMVCEERQMNAVVQARQFHDTGGNSRTIVKWKTVIPLAAVGEVSENKLLLQNSFQGDVKTLVLSMTEWRDAICCCQSLQLLFCFQYRHTLISYQNIAGHNFQLKHLFGERRNVCLERGSLKV